MKLEKLGICGIISLLSYTAMVVFSPLAYPGYNWMTMAVSDLGAVGAPSESLSSQLNAFFGPCGIVCIMAVVVAAAALNSKVLKTGIYFWAAMEWICNVGYKCFPWVEGADLSSFQNIMHLVVTVAVVVLSILSLVLIAVGGWREKNSSMKSLSIWAIVCLVFMMGGAMGTGLLPKSVFGLFERFSTFSAVVFNAILGVYLLMGKFGVEEVC